MLQADHTALCTAAAATASDKRDGVVIVSILFRRTFHRQVQLLQENDDSSSSGNKEQHQKQQQRRRLDVAIVGLPNSGKSKILNRLTGQQISAVSHKRHTTRHEVMAARTVKDTQILFVDTPGFMRVDEAKAEGLDRDLTTTAMAEIQDVDFTLLVVDAAKRMTDTVRGTLAELIMESLLAQGRLELDESTGGSRSARIVRGGQLPTPQKICRHFEQGRPREAKIETAGCSNGNGGHIRTMYTLSDGIIRRARRRRRRNVR